MWGKMAMAGMPSRRASTAAKIVFGREEIERFGDSSISEVLKRLDHTWSVIFVGDAWMAPSELASRNGAITFSHRNAVTGLKWLERIRERVPNSVWINPEPNGRWNLNGWPLNNTS